MSEPLIGAVDMWGCEYAPKYWAKCNGALLPISGSKALYSVIGTTYGGDGRSTFALPNLVGSVPTHDGAGHNLTPLSLGETGGQNQVVLEEEHLPSHKHQLVGEDQVPESGSPNSKSLIGAMIIQGEPKPAYTETLDQTYMASGFISLTGSGKAHENRQPYLTVNFCIAQYGVLPSRG